ncbi:MucB/RseB C-terminal domain-containing protein [Trinickia caryophylli]|uniref:Sigma E regulatory protein, MucB/RseB n=1 Tax=Trinickia caryophylli TaxID=28094 RepID=A0A1X7DUW5_TRICW|nr:MucB/RseB C-terminal domain-containing protein [Trinickia caryophylli]PMS09212.1 sugar dehydratase [Trinickia caryophylli]TRX17989.1 sugar dehydratase [Trinickia caryophylli]WQE11232.1 MucB/RseB C-terminal domain-containing protein [Trinickia caryophylli]SMF22107.1 sigma E regulatory protein, MucB/RseB [Trinickia caryophylli]GLU32378.1 sugar dehydratase [Trinickia caryophylli]
MPTSRFGRLAAFGRLPALLCAAILLLPCAEAARAASQPAAASSDRGAASWLGRIAHAARQENYEGVFVYQRGTFVQSSRIAHYATRGEGEFESLESLDGKPRKLLRHDDDVYTFLPERHLCIVERRQNKDAFPALLSDGDQQVLTVYDPKLLGTDRVAGIDAQVIELAPKDAYRFTYKLWADAKTGLLLREQTLDASGQVLEQVSFTQLRVGVPAEKARIAAGIRNTSGWTLVRPPAEPVDMEAHGWTIAPDVPGFRKIREVRRPMAARDAGAPAIPVDQAVFSDGLTTVSVFIEPAEKNSRKEGAGESGATHVLVTRHGDYWITLLGEVPQGTLQVFASAIKYKAPK